MNESRRQMQAPPDAETLIDGRRVLYFGGTSYLGLHGHPRVLEAAAAALWQYGLHPATSRAGYGDSPVLRLAEERAAEYFGTEAALSLTSGWFGVGVLLAALDDAGASSRLFLDAAAHWCAVEAARGSGLPTESWASGDPASLRAALAGRLRSGERPIVVTDGVFAADGRIAPLGALAEIVAEYPGGVLLVDDAHGVGCLGAEGLGALEHESVWPPGGNTEGGAVGLVCTASKALGGFGGLVPGTEAFVARLWRTAKVLGGASSVPTPAAAATAAAFEVLRDEPERRASLRANVARLRAALRALGLDVDDASPSPIVGLSQAQLGRAPRSVHEALWAQDILAPFLARYAGVPDGGMLRIAVFATHTEAQIDELVETLGRAL